MALRGAAAAAAAAVASASSSQIGRRRSPLILSIPRHFTLNSPYHSKTLLPIPVHQPTGEFLSLSPSIFIYFSLLSITQKNFYFWASVFLKYMNGVSLQLLRSSRDAGFQCQILAISRAAAEPAISKKEDKEEQSPKDWKIKMLYDGDCPLCMREVCLFILVLWLSIQ